MRTVQLIKPAPMAGPSAFTRATHPFIELCGVEKRYRTRSGADVDAIGSATFNIDRGEFVSIVGPSGCGKTTLLKIVGGLMAPTQGTLRYADELPPKLGIVFQDAVLLPWRTVLQNVLLPAEVQNLDASAAERRAKQLIELVGLVGFEGKYPHELSGGMQQRASIARALLNEPSLLLMDEPFAALDAMTRESMSLELQRIWLASKATVFFITHSISEAVFLSDRVVVMTSRPSRVRAIIEVEHPRPRSLRDTGSRDFVQHVEHVRELLESDGKASS